MEPDRQDAESNEESSAPAGTPARWELQQQHRRMSALAEIELDARSLHSTLERIAQVATDLLPAERGATVILWNEDQGTFTTASSTVSGQDDEEPLFRLRATGGTTRWIIDNNRRLAVDDVADDPFGVSPFAAEYDVHAYVGVPIVGDAGTLGVLYALAPRPRAWTELDLVFLETLARRAAGAITTANLVAEAQDARERAEALSHIANALIGVSNLSDVLQTIVDGVAAALDADRVLLVTMDVNEQKVIEQVTGGVGADGDLASDFGTLMGGLTGYAIEANTVIVSPKGARDEREGTDQHATRITTDTGAVLVAPLRYQGRASGTLTAIRRLEQPNFVPEDAGLITVMANQAAIAIENARLTQETEEALAELSAVFEIVKAQNTEQNLDHLLDSLTEAAAGALMAEQVVLFLADPDQRHIERVTVSSDADDQADALHDFDLFWESLSGWVFRNRRPALAAHANDQRESERVRSRLVGEGVGPRMVVPLFDRGSVVGTLVVSNPEGAGEFTQKDVEMASIMATQMAVAITNAKLFAETQRLAITDELTGVHNRRHLFTLAEREVATARRYGRLLAAIMFDIDNFKLINDTYGHAVGDEVLRAVARRCSGVIRDVDVLGRYGGEEFAVLLPETQLKGGVETAERLRTAIGGQPIVTSVGEVAVTISAGVAELTEEIDGVHELLDRADAAMLFAKRLGRNRTRAG